MKLNIHIVLLLFLPMSYTLMAQTNTSGSFVDPRDGKEYRTLVIGNQTWMAENLNFYTDTGSWDYDNNPENSGIYGRLYSWPAACEACPSGWRLPGDTDWYVLGESIGNQNFAGGKMKEKGTEHWKSPNLGATNESGFSVLPAGYCFDGNFYDIGKSASFWSSTASGYEDQYVWHRFFYHNITAFYRYRYNYLKFGYSVRCILDNPLKEKTPEQ